MSKLHFIGQSQKGTIVASIFVKPNGHSIAFNNQVKENGKFVDAPKGTKLIDINYGDSLWAVPNNRKKPGDKLPDFIVYAYPEDQPEETPVEALAVA